MKVATILSTVMLLLNKSLAENVFVQDSLSFEMEESYTNLNPNYWLGRVLQDQSMSDASNLLDASVDDQDAHRHLARRFRGCDVLRVWVRKSDIDRAALATSTGYSFQVPFYERGSDRQLGVWYEQLTYSNLEQTLGSGFVTFRFNVNTSLAMSIVVGQRQLAILGGSGRIGTCPGGFGIVTGDRVDRVDFKFTICDAC